MEHGGPDLSWECAVPGTLEHDESRTGDGGDGVGACVAAGWPDEGSRVPCVISVGSCNSRAPQSCWGSEHCRLLTKFAVGVVGPLNAYHADFGEPSRHQADYSGPVCRRSVQVDQLLAGILCCMEWLLPILVDFWVGRRCPVRLFECTWHSSSRDVSVAAGQRPLCLQQAIMGAQWCNGQ